MGRRANRRARRARGHRQGEGMGVVELTLFRVVQESLSKSSGTREAREPRYESNDPFAESLVRLENVV
jgi:hypothetical protein